MWEDILGYSDPQASAEKRYFTNRGYGVPEAGSDYSLGSMQSKQRREARQQADMASTLSALVQLMIMRNKNKQSGVPARNAGAAQGQGFNDDLLMSGFNQPSHVTEDQRRRAEMLRWFQNLQTGRGGYGGY